MELLDAVIKCEHCGNIGNCKVKASYTYDIFVETIQACEQWTWYLFQCSACSKPILVEGLPSSEEKPDYAPSIFNKYFTFIAWDSKGAAKAFTLETWQDDFKILYPVAGYIKYSHIIPQDVFRAYSAAVRVRTADPNAFAVMVGRTLEVICHYEKAQGKVLADKIKNLADSGRIPQNLAHMAGQLRLIRNLAVHADKDNYEVKEKDIPIINEFVDAIIEYIYIAPNKIAQLQKRIDDKFAEDDLDNLDGKPF